MLEMTPHAQTKKRFSLLISLNDIVRLCVMTLCNFLPFDQLNIIVDRPTN